MVVAFTGYRPEKMPFLEIYSCARVTSAYSSIFGIISPTFP